MPTTPINALPSPSDASPNQPWVHFDALNAQLDSRLVPRFASAAARDAAITAPIAGMICAVGSELYTYKSSAWRPVAANFLRIGATANTYSAAPSTNIGFPGLTACPSPYSGAILRVELRASIRFLAGSAQTAQINIGLTGATEIQGDSDVIDRTTGGSGETSYVITRVSYVTTTGSPFTVGYQLVAGSGASNVVITNPRCFITGPHYAA